VFTIERQFPAGTTELWFAVGYHSAFEIRQGVCIDDIVIEVATP
jgi:hypothetical protein